MIIMRYKLELMSLNSRRGNYTPVILEENPLIWEPVPLDESIQRTKDVFEEIAHAQFGILNRHKYWKDEPFQFVRAYEDFYTNLFSLKWLHKNEDRHSIISNADCCLTLVQYHNHRLIAYSRSTDMRNGYFSDKIVLEYLAQQINSMRSDCQVHSIEWYLAVPHVYDQKGVARLLEGEEIK